MGFSSLISFDDCASCCPPGVVFWLEAAGDNGGVGVYEGFGLLDGGTIQDEDAAQFGVVAHGACN